MPNLNQQTNYWNRVAETKTFPHPLDHDLLASLLPKSARILDYGCGYGRLCHELKTLGYHNVIGLDISEAMIARGRRINPTLHLDRLDGPRIPFPSESFDAVTLFAVLTCVPTDAGQQEIIAEIQRVLKPGGILYLSDYLLQTNDRNLARYQKHAPLYGTYGVFALEEGPVLRHHPREWLMSLLDGMHPLHEKELTVQTMNNHPARILQCAGRMPSAIGQ